jgi:hypothetical protein
MAVRKKQSSAQMVHCSGIISNLSQKAIIALLDPDRDAFKKSYGIPSDSVLLWKSTFRQCKS